MDKQMSIYPVEAAVKGCCICRHYSELKTPRIRSDGATIYGYCFKDGDKDYSVNMGKGYPVFVVGGSACKQFKACKRAALGEERGDV